LEVALDLGKLPGACTQVEAAVAVFSAARRSKCEDEYGPEAASERASVAKRTSLRHRHAILGTTRVMDELAGATVAQRAGDKP
jgi:hypothetical protein